MVVQKKKKKKKGRSFGEIKGNRPVVVQSSWFCWLVCHHRFVLMLERMNLTPLGGWGGVCVVPEKEGVHLQQNP